MRMPEFEFTRWSGRVQRVEAERVEFAQGGSLVFWDNDVLVLAVKQGDWNDVCQVQPSSDDPAGAP